MLLLVFKIQIATFHHKVFLAMANDFIILGLNKKVKIKKLKVLCDDV